MEHRSCSYSDNKLVDYQKRNLTESTITFLKSAHSGNRKRLIFV